MPPMPQSTNMYLVSPTDPRTHYPFYPFRGPPRTALCAQLYSEWYMALRAEDRAAFVQAMLGEEEDSQGSEGGEGGVGGEGKQEGGDGGSGGGSSGGYCTIMGELNRPWDEHVLPIHTLRLETFSLLQAGTGLPAHPVKVRRESEKRRVRDDVREMTCER